MSDLMDKGANPKTPPLQGRGKGWGLSSEQLDTLKARAKEMRSNPTEPEKRLWRNLSASKLDGFKFRRQEVIGNAIADFYCAPAKLIVEVDGDTHHDPAKDAQRDTYLGELGYRVLHVSNDDVMRNIDGVLESILSALGNADMPHPHPSPEGEGLERRKTLNLRDTADAEAPALKKKGRGWEISEKRLDVLHDQARDMKRHASEAHKALAARFAKADLGKYTFKRFAVVGSAIVDFNCHNLGMCIVIDEEGDDEKLNRRRDKSLESVGIKVMHLKAEDILENIDDVLKRITAGMRLRIADKNESRRKHFAEQPRHNQPRYDRDGNGPPRRERNP